MKKIILILGVIITTLSSCSNYIEEESLSNVPADEAYKTAAGFQLLVNSNYAWLKGIYGGNPWLFCSGTDMYSDTNKAPEPAGLSQYTTLIPISPNVEELYSSCYQQIQAVNKTLYYSTITEKVSNLNELVGEARFLRANAYFLLVQTYGGVPIINEHITSAVTSFDRNTAEEVYTQIIADLDFALANVGTAAYSTTGKVNKRAVNDLLAKVYLTRGYETFGKQTDFATAATYADAAIAGQALNVPFDQLFKPGNDLNAETIFSVQYDKNSTSTSPTTLGNRQYLYFSTYLGGSETGAPTRSNNLIVTNYTLNLFEQGDTRWNATFMTEVLRGPETQPNGTVKQVSYFPFYRSTNLSTTKVYNFFAPKWFTPADKTAYINAITLAGRKDPAFVYHDFDTAPNKGYGAEFAQGTDPKASTDEYTISVRKFDDPDPTTPIGALASSTRDIILARLGETYLIAAEAYFKAGNPTTALARLNEVRRRAGGGTAGVIPVRTTINIDVILDERARELVGEYKRWFDLKRTGTLIDRCVLYNPRITSASNFDGANGQKKILRPIPQLALNLNQNKDFPQNPAYN